MRAERVIKTLTTSKLSEPEQKCADAECDMPFKKQAFQTAGLTNQHFEMLVFLKGPGQQPIECDMLTYSIYRLSLLANADCNLYQYFKSLNYNFRKYS